MKLHTAKTTMLCSAAFAVVCLAHPAAAQESASNPPPADNADSQNDIIVTAQKRSERLAEIPQSISVISADTLERSGATQFRDFANTVPGLSFATSGAGATQVNLRGITTGTDLSSAVGIYVDDVPYGSSSSYASGAQSALDVALFDLDRIEVLRGPQGTLYGAAAMGGLLKYITTAPDTSDFGGRASLGISDTAHGGVGYNGSAVINVPVVENTVAVRASAYGTHDGGFIDNLALGSRDVDRADIYGGRLDLLFKPTDRLSIRVGGFLQNISRDGQATADYTVKGVPIDGSLDQRRRLPEPYDQRFRLISGIINYDIDWASLTSISSYQSLWAEQSFDASGIFLPIFNAAPFNRNYSAVGSVQVQTTKKFTQEVRLASTAERPTISWLVGAFYTHERSNKIQTADPRDQTGAPTVNDISTVALPSIYEEIAGFGNLTWNISSQVDATAGIRYARNTQTVTQIGSGLRGVSRPKRSASESVATYLANIRYRPNDRTLFYARFATGYRPGGPNIVPSDPVTGQPLAPPSYEADTLQSYEVGLRLETPRRDFAVDLAGYYIDWNNVQIVGRRNTFSIRTNAGQAAVVGAELAFTIRPVREFTVVGAFAYQDAHLSENAPDIGGTKGDQLPNVPKVTASLNADYVARGSDWAPSFGASIRFVSERRQNFGAARYELPSYATVDLRAGVRINDFDVQVFARNIFDSRGQLSELTLGPAQVALQQPRTIGIRVSTDF